VRRPGRRRPRRLVRSHHGHQPRAELAEPTTQPYACGRATDFPAATGTLVSPLDCPPDAAEAELTTCRLAHAKELTRQARELTVEAHEMFGMPVAQQARCGQPCHSSL
jgi:hypothetical protein